MKKLMKCGETMPKGIKHNSIKALNLIRWGAGKQVKQGGASRPIGGNLPLCLSPDMLKKDEELLNKLFNKQL